jgi:FKBP-type peptidyl-prolyl cis-trans isomerase FklB
MRQAHLGLPEGIFMNQLVTVVAALLTVAAVMPAWAADPAADKPAPVELKTTKDKASYSIGLSIGRNMKREGFDLDYSRLAAGIADGLRGNAQLTDEQIGEVMEQFQKQHATEQAGRAKVAADKNKKEGAEFLAANKEKKGVVTTKSGLQYQILKEGKGPKPTKDDTVTTHYVGTLLDGTEFDSSIKRGEPASFPVGGVIGGWTEALQLMPVGSKWRLFVPSELAYGAHGAGRDIGPNATLVFEVELLGIGDEEEIPAGE